MIPSSRLLRTQPGRLYRSEIALAYSTRVYYLHIDHLPWSWRVGMIPKVVTVRFSMNPGRVFCQANAIDLFSVMVAPTRTQDRDDSALFLRCTENRRELVQTLSPEPSTRSRRRAERSSDLPFRIQLRTAGNMSTRARISG
jgi:hypothetical protein